MNREEKTAIVSELQQRFQQAHVALLASAQGLTVGEVGHLRRALRAVDGEFKVAKNTLTRRAIKDTGFASLHELLNGPNALVLGYRDPVAVAKVLVKFADDHKNLEIRGGVMDGNTLAAQSVADLARLPSREAILGQLLGLLQAPAVQLLRTMQEPGARLARLLERVRARKAETEV